MGAVAEHGVSPRVCHPLNGPTIIAPTILAASMRGEGLSPEPSRVGIVSIWCCAMYPELG